MQLLQHLILFICMAINWYGIYSQNWFMHESIKPAVMTLIIIFYCLNTKLKYKSDKLVVLGFIGSLLGDTFLIFAVDDENFFLAGLFSFALSHIVYIFLFFKSKKSDTPVLGEPRNGIYIATIFLFGYMYYFLEFLLPNVPEDLTIPVIFYATLIEFMILTSLFRKNYTSKKSYLLILAGAFLFVISDSALSVQKFVSPAFDLKEFDDIDWEGSSPLAQTIGKILIEHQRYIRLFVMVTYYIAQWLIFVGIQSHNIDVLDYQQLKQHKNLKTKKEN